MFEFYKLCQKKLFLRKGDALHVREILEWVKNCLRWGVMVCFYKFHARFIFCAPLLQNVGSIEMKLFRFLLCRTVQKRLRISISRRKVPAREGKLSYWIIRKKNTDLKQSECIFKCETKLTDQKRLVFGFGERGWKFQMSHPNAIQKNNECEEKIKRPFFYSRCDAISLSIRRKKKQLANAYRYKCAHPLTQNRTVQSLNLVVFSCVKKKHNTKQPEEWRKYKKCGKCNGKKYWSIENKKLCIWTACGSLGLWVPVPWAIWIIWVFDRCGASLRLPPTQPQSTCEAVVLEKTANKPCNN